MINSSSSSRSSSVSSSSSTFSAKLRRMGDELRNMNVNAPAPQPQSRLARASQRALRRSFNERVGLEVSLPHAPAGSVVGQQRSAHVPTRDANPSDSRPLKKSIRKVQQLAQLPDHGAVLMDLNMGGVSTPFRAGIARHGLGQIEIGTMYMPEYERSSTRDGYDDAVRVLSGTPQEEQQRAAAILAILDNPANQQPAVLAQYTQEIRKAIVSLIAMTQVAEAATPSSLIANVNGRTPAMDKLARGLLRQIAAGNKRFTVFSSVGGEYPPAAQGGTQQARTVVATDSANYDGYLSDSSTD